MSRGSRIDQILAHRGLGSRKDFHKLIRKGLVTVNGELIRKPGERVDPGADVRVDD